MFEKTSRLAERVANNLSRRSFMGSIGKWAAATAGVLAGLLTRVGSAWAYPSADSISITCPPVPGGGGGGLLLKSNFKVTGTWGSDAPPTQIQIKCQFIPAGGGAAIDGTVTVNEHNTWSATFNINPPLNGSLKAVFINNGTKTAQAGLGGLQVVATGGGSC
jgi:hypothetical protein